MAATTEKVHGSDVLDYQGYGCPTCDSDDFERVSEYVDGETARLGYRCEGCKAEWTEHYGIKRVSWGLA